MTDDCILWEGAKLGPSGYGVQRYQGSNKLSHRVAYCEANNIPIEEIRGKMVLHLCDNPGCINPKHLILGNHQLNMDHKTERGRNAVGSDVGSSKLSEEQVLEIKAKYKPHCSINGGRALARIFGVNQTAISAIVTGKSWRYLE